MGHRCSALVFALLMMSSEPALGHPLAPSFLDIRVEEAGAELSFKTPAQANSGVLVPLFPSECEPVGRMSTEREGSGVVRRWRVRCARDIWLGRAVGIQGLAAAGTNGIVRVSIDGVPVVRAVIEPSRPSIVVPPLPVWTTTAGTYFALGIRHIALGLDHLLFVTGLLLLVRGLRRVAGTVTAFTLGHSLTLALAVLGFVRVSAALVELGIAASLMLVAVEALALRSEREDSRVEPTANPRCGLWSAARPGLCGGAQRARAPRGGHLARAAGLQRGDRGGTARVCPVDTRSRRSMAKARSRRARVECASDRIRGRLHGLLLAPAANAGVVNGV